MASVQVYDGDGLSEHDRIAQALLEAEHRAARAMLPKRRGVKMKWTVEAMEDFKSVHDVSLGDILTKTAVDEMMRDLSKAMGVPNELLTATK